MATVIWKSRRRPRYYGTYSLGNSKLPYTTAIFNMTTATDCPADKLGLCQARRKNKEGKEIQYCYALKTEKTFPKSSLIYRQKQAKFWDNCTVGSFIKQFKESHLTGPKKITHLRLNECGDFRTQADVNKADRIAEVLKTYNIKVYCYTSRSDLDYSNVRYLRIMGSGFKTSGIRGEFRIVENASDKPDGFGVCPADCTKCKRCVIGLDTVVVLH
jgi:hypothetical protein